ncbi:hypothetical protein HQ520_15240 [bacterium]|nr:hypothetical protein [bacterium]
MPKEFLLEGLVAGEWETLLQIEDNHQRHHRYRIARDLEGVRFTLQRTWGAEESSVFAFLVQ